MNNTLCLVPNLVSTVLPLVIFRIGKDRHLEEGRRMDIMVITEVGEVVKQGILDFSNNSM